MENNKAEIIERFIITRINTIGIVLLFTILAAYGFNSSRVGAIYRENLEVLLKDINKLEEDKEKAAALNRLLMRNMHIVGEKFPIPLKYERSNRDKMVIAISHYNDPVYSRSRMLGVFKNIMSIKNGGSAVYSMILDYELYREILPDVLYFSADSSLRITTPAIVITGGDVILQAFSFYDNINKETIDLIVNTSVKIVTNK